MPTYEYECEGCGRSHEEFQSIKDPPLKVCPHCRQPKLRRLVGAGAGLLFKGSGFYITDYRSNEYKEKAKKESGVSSSSCSSSTSGAGSCGSCKTD